MFVHRKMKDLLIKSFDKKGGKIVDGKPQNSNFDAISAVRAYFRGERNSLAWEYYEGFFPFSQRLSANLILKSHKFHIFVIKHSVLGILHGNLSTNARQLTPKITAFDKSK